MKGILLDESGELSLSGGRIATGEADGQSIENLLRANRGEFKEAPLVGGEVSKMMGGQPSGLWCARLKKQIQSLGIRVSNVAMTGNEITVQQ